MSGTGKLPWTWSIIYIRYPQTVKLELESWSLFLRHSFVLMLDDNVYRGVEKLAASNPQLLLER
jgi:hypothetical protein